MNALNFPPMLAERSSPASGRVGKDFRKMMKSGNYVADTKLDGVRALARWDQATQAVVLWNRSLVDVTFKYPDVVTLLTPVLRDTDGFVLDGEIIAADGSFESTAKRDQQQNPKAIAALLAAYPVNYIAFDYIPVWVGEDIIGAGTPRKQVPYWERRASLEDLAKRYAYLSITPISDSPDFLDMTRELGMEGAVIKTKAGSYTAGRSLNWIKFRNLFRVTCLVSHYTPGTGARKDFGAMELALIGPDGPVSVGRCGTGFKTHEIAGLKAAIDTGDHPLVVEIETTNQTKNNTLRFPVFKGVRSDLLPTDCTFDQLQGLPTC